MELLSEQAFLKELAKLVNANEMHLRIVESETFKNFVNNLQPNLIFPSSRALAKECLRLKFLGESSRSPSSPLTVFDF
jgi:hypothetical protein